ncbi:MAG: phytoene desaturase family protein [Bradymonadaceae bacterium]
MTIAVVGAGMGGLAAAIEMAARDHEVIVYERAEGPGGKVGVAEEKGAAFDTGPSVLTLPRVLAALFGTAGRGVEEELNLVQPAPWFQYRFPDGTRLDVHHDVTDTLASVEATMGAAARDDLAEFLEYAFQIWEAAAPNFIFAPAPSVGSMLNLGLSAPSEIWNIDPLSTMWGAIKKRVDDERLRWLLARYATYVGADPREAPATLNCIAWVELGGGAYGIDGGMYELALALERIAADLGVEFRYETPVHELVVDDGAVDRVIAEDGEESVDAAVVNADVGHLVEDLMPAAGVDAITSEAPASMSGWTAVWQASEIGAGDRAAHTVLFPETYLEEFDAIFGEGRVPASPTIYACNQGLSHGREGWAEADPLFAMVNAPPVSRTEEREDWEALSRRVGGRLAAAGLVADDDPVVWARTSDELADQFPGSSGAIYGRAANSRLAAFRRPPNRVSQVDGLYLASGSAHPGGGVPMCLQSGRLAARAAAEDTGD